MAFPVFNRHQSKAFDQNGLGKSGQRFVGQWLTGNRGSFFTLRNFGKGRWAGWSQRTTERAKSQPRRW